MKFRLFVSILALVLGVGTASASGLTPAPSAVATPSEEIQLETAKPEPLVTEGKGQEAGAEADSAPFFAPTFAAGGGGTTCHVTAKCAVGTISCTGLQSCAAQNASCRAERGWVECDGLRQNCGLCPGTCNHVHDCPPRPGCEVVCQTNRCVYSCS